MRAIKRAELEAARRAAEDSLCRGGASPVTLPRAAYESEVPYVERMLKCQSIRSGDMSSLARTTEDLKLASADTGLEGPGK